MCLVALADVNISVTLFFLRRVIKYRLAGSIIFINRSADITMKYVNSAFSIVYTRMYTEIKFVIQGFPIKTSVSQN